MSKWNKTILYFFDIQKKTNKKNQRKKIEKLKFEKNNNNM